jgi:uncharacterized protein (TIGR00297 family)
MRIPASEWTRKAVHAGMGLCALALRWLSWPQAALLALAALLFNLFAMPRIGRGIYRDRNRSRDTGIVAYPAVVLALLLLFRHNIYIVAAVWAMMAFGDPAASIVGRLLEGPSLPWNRGKTWAGLLADWSIGGLAAVLVFRFVSARPLEPGAVAMLLAGAAVYACLESVKAGLDDNVVAGIPTALLLFQWDRASVAGAALWPAISAESLLAALGVNVAVAFATWRLGLVAFSGAVAGALVGALVVLFGGWGAYAVLWAFFLGGTVATKLGYSRKARIGMAQADSGRRGVAHVVANVGIPLVLLASGVRPVAYVAALAAALADTLGTEIGGLLGRHPFSLVRLRPMTPGTPGAVSAAGLAAGLLGAAFVGLVGFAGGLIGAWGVAIVAAAGLAGSLAESVVHDFGGARGFRLDHDFANAFNTLVGALVALEISISIDAHSLFVPVVGA